MGHEILGVVEIVAIIVVLALLPLVVLAARRRWLNRRGGSFECSARLDAVRLVPVPSGEVDTRSGARWSLGVGRYAADTFEWFRFFSLAFTPRLAWKRTDMAVLAVRDPDPAEIGQLFAAHRIVRFSVAEAAYEVSMDARQLTGFLAWLEAAPPGAPHSPGSAY